jgi:hypothetical protein
MALLANAQRTAVEQTSGPVDGLKAAMLALDTLLQCGTATLASGTVTIAANITANSRILLAIKDPGAGALTTFIGLDAPVANRTVGTPGSFVVNALANDKTTLTTAVCTFDWYVCG